LNEGLEQLRRLHTDHLSHSLDHVLEYAQMGREEERKKERQKRDLPVVQNLGRPLTTAESILTRVMHEQGKTPAEMAAILGGLSPAKPMP
jgi:hypothetical protein